MGQAFVKSIYSMLYNTGDRAQADSTLLIVVYDEHGSFYDHQDPGKAFALSSGGKDADRNFQPLGFRVPAMIVGPMVKQKHVSHTIYDHSSVLRTLYNWALLHKRNNTGVIAGMTDARPEAKGAQTQAMIDEVYARGFEQDHPLRPLHATNYENFIHKPMLRVLAANDISDCLNPNYEPGRVTMPPMPKVETKEHRVLANLQFSEGQTGIAKAFGVPQPSFSQKIESAKRVMDHFYRLGAIDIG
jgi:hypothetical protein